jgi:predicted membrane-bound mannosyltransferase
MSDETTSGAAGAPASAGRPTAWLIAIVFAVLFAAPVYYGLSDLVSYPAFAGGRTPWWLLIAGVVLPLALYVGGLLAGRGRTPVLRTVILGAALGAANGLTISGIAMAITLLSA